MRKQSGGSQPERSNVRVLYIDGDLAAGEIQNMTNALIAAIRPAQVTMRPSTPKRLTAPQEVDGNGTGRAELELEDAEIVEERDDSPRVTKAPRAPRTYRMPDAVDMDMAAGGKPFEEFAKEKAPADHRARYLVAAAWLHDYAKIESITPAHVFTCYKAADWVFDVSDPGVTLRSLKRERLGTTKDGGFAINHLGLAEVKKMNAKP